jgi:hemerythrin
MKVGRGKAILAEIIDEVAKYADFHFATEEKLFIQYDYPGTVSHKKLHGDFVVGIINFEF